MQNQFIPLSFCYMLWLLIILIFSWLFWGCSIFILNILFFVWFYWQTSLAAKKVQNDLASLQNHSTFGDKLDIIDGFALKFVMIFRQNISYFQTLLSLRQKPHAIEEGFSFVVGFKMMCLNTQLTRRWNMGALWNSIQLLQHSVSTKC